MKIISIVASLAHGDAVSNDALAIHEMLSKQGFETVLAAERLYYHPDGVQVRDTGDLSFVGTKDIVIYHLSTGTTLNYLIPEKKRETEFTLILRYHNITPPMFFKGYSKEKMAGTLEGIRGAKYLAAYADGCICDSEYNKNDLIHMGYQCPMDVVPILMDFRDFKAKEDVKTYCELKKDSDCINILFTGRIVPNKRQEEVMQAFYYYNKYYHANSKLYFVGGYVGNEKYYGELLDYQKRLGMDDIFFAGHIGFRQMLAYYKAADIFLCMSDHEGFCVPILEAMSFGIPVLAKDAGAVGETMGDAGLLLDGDPKLMAAAIHRVVSDEELRAELQKKMACRLEYFAKEKVAQMFMEKIKNYIK